MPQHASVAPKRTDTTDESAACRRGRSAKIGAPAEPAHDVEPRDAVTARQQIDDRPSRDHPIGSADTSASEAGSSGSSYATDGANSDCSRFILALEVNA